MKVAGYIRVSTEEQSREGISLEMQADRIRAYCESQGWALAALYEDAGASGTHLQRPGLQRLLASLQDVDAILVWKVDRLSRRQKHVLSILEDVLEPAGVGFKSVTEPFDTTTPMGKAFLGMLAVFAQLERDTIAHRTREALRHVQAAGRHVGAPPFGFTAGVNGLEPVPAELEVVQQAGRLRAAGYTLRQIAEWLSARGVPTRRNGRWSPEHVRLMLANRAYQQAPGQGDGHDGTAHPSEEVLR